MTASSTAIDRDFDPVDLSPHEFWSQPASGRAEGFAQLRASRPVSWQRPVEGGYGQLETEGGFSAGASSLPFWAVVRHKDVREVSRNTEVFSSASGVMIEEMPREYLEVNSSFLVMDPPRHSRYRRIVSGAFTPRSIAVLEDDITRKATELVDQAVAQGQCEVVTALSNRLPLWTISQLLGVPEEHRVTMMDNANLLVGTDDPELYPPGTDVTQKLMGAAFALHGLAHELVAHRRAEPGDDLISRLALAEVDGDQLTDMELGSVFILFSVAGNDTSRNTITRGIKAFADNPDQWDLFRSDPAARLKGAVEEALRWASPVIQFRRTATRDVELAGQQIARGDPVVVFYESANRDESVFDDPWRFDITREPAHLTFGGGGPHFCMGAHLARRQVGAVFTRLAATVDRFEAGEAEQLASHFVNGVRRMNCTFHRSR